MARFPKPPAQNEEPHGRPGSKTGGQYGAGRIQADETAAAAFCPLYDPAVLYFYGSHDGVAARPAPCWGWKMQSALHLPNSCC